MGKQLELPVVVNTKTTTVAKSTKIFDKLDTSNIGILYWQEDTLKDIVSKSGPLAKDNEFQIHYWALVARLKFHDESIIDIAFPTVIYNYKQEVSGAHIDFELKDVDAMSTALEPVHNMVINKNKLENKIKELFDQELYTIEFLSVPMNTLHRHPTGVSSFSSTDLNKNHTYNTGIVFPLKTGNETPSFSSIIYNNPVKIVHTEYRIATGNTEEEGIHYKKGRCATFVKSKISTVSKAEEYFSVKAKDLSYTVTKESDIDFTNLVDLKAIEYTPNTDFIKEKNLTKKVYVTNYSKNTKSTKDSNQTTTIYDKDIVKEIKNTIKIDILNFIQLQNFHMDYLKQHCLKLEQFYYQDAELTMEEYKELNKKDLVELAMELQDLIVEEYTQNDIDIDEEDEDTIWSYLESEFSSKTQSTVPTEEKKQALKKLGVADRVLETVSNRTIDKWYEEILN